MTEPSVGVLYHSVRPRVLAYLLGRVGLVLVALALVPMSVALMSGLLGITLRYLIVLAPLGLLCWPLARLSPPTDLRGNEGLVVTALAFLLSPLLMAYPLSGAGVSYSAALFEAVSAVTTTGLSTLPAVADKPPAFLFARAWMQWYGGLGIVALLPLWLEPGRLPRRLLGLEVEAEPLTSAWIYTWRIGRVYLAITGLAFFLLWGLGGDPFAALVHALAAISTGGFSSLDRGLTELGAPFAVGVMGVSLLGALPFAMYLGLPGSWWRDLQLRALLVNAFLSACLIAAILVWQQGFGWGPALFHGVLTAISAQTTAGFSTLEVGTMPPAVLGLLLATMLSGGGLGSTAGGIKWLRILIFLRTLILQLRRLALPPHAWIELRLGNQIIDESLSSRVQLLILLYVLTVFVSWLPFLLWGYDPLRSLFEVVSAVATVGLSVGITDMELPGLLRCVLGLDMWLGRVEIFAVLVLFNPVTWRTSR
ncbi:TrkH family potassium uptake protein [Methylohalobius crimeensis]|uniref:TrkH family potassium uptake protein n=1 Tax=Methylohalobius crimeensis TaxID=244365 RepID=UPI000479DDD9|nr:potassium transporter TrkG [Methylohalobius crimeensis]